MDAVASRPPNVCPVGLFACGCINEIGFQLHTDNIGRPALSAGRNWNLERVRKSHLMAAAAVAAAVDLAPAPLAR